MHYLYDEPSIMYPQLLTAACKAEPEQEDRPEEGVLLRSVQLEGKDEITGLKKTNCAIMGGDPETNTANHICQPWTIG